MNSMHRQQGMSFIAIVAIVALVAFAGIFGLKVGPAYLENMTVKQIVEETNANSQVMKQPRSKVLTHIDRAFRTNNLWDLRADETVVIEKVKGGGAVIKVDYEKRTNLFANLFVVSVFKDADAK